MSFAKIWLFSNLYWLNIWSYQVHSDFIVLEIKYENCEVLILANYLRLKMRFFLIILFVYCHLTIHKSSYIAFVAIHKDKTHKTASKQLNLLNDYRTLFWMPNTKQILLSLRLSVTCSNKPPLLSCGAVWSKLRTQRQTRWKHSTFACKVPTLPACQHQ